jgi:hypothetical protein
MVEGPPGIFPATGQDLVPYIVRFVPGTIILAGRLPRATPAGENSGGASAVASALTKSPTALHRHKIISSVLIRRRSRAKSNDVQQSERARDGNVTLAVEPYEKGSC